MAIKVAAALQKKQPIYFLKIEPALMLQTEPVIPKSTMLDLVTKNTFPLAKSSPEFEGTLRYRITGIICGRKVSQILRIWDHSRMFSCTFYLS